MFKTLRGTKDILPQEVGLWQEVENRARHIFLLYAYQEIRTSLIEETGLFSRSLGDASEVVQKQMFSVVRATVHSGVVNQVEEKDSMALRPEGTAAIVRSYIENSLDKTQGFSKLYYIGPMFRAERPQKGRLRQFHHIGAEAIGSLSAFVDIEIISLAHRLLVDFGVEGFTININSLGCADDKNKLAEELKKHLTARLALLCEDCKARFENNVLRILDCKKEECRKVVRGIDMGQGYLCADCRSHFETVKNGLEALGIKYSVLPYLVRGLDYYTRTVFEITHSGLGSQDALGAGGRYDNLVKQLGGSAQGAIGFALGIERVLLAKKTNHCESHKKLAFVVTLGEAEKREGLRLIESLRKNNIPADMDYEGRSLKAALRRADDQGARFAIIIGEDEVKKGVVTLKDMVLGGQKEIKQEALIAELA